MIDRSHALPVTRQARELGISRGGVYYLPRPSSVADLAMMRRLDELRLSMSCGGDDDELRQLVTRPASCIAHRTP